MTCTDCQGHGQVVKVIVLYDAEGNQIIQHRAMTCDTCAGYGEV